MQSLAKMSSLENKFSDTWGSGYAGFDYGIALELVSLGLEAKSTLKGRPIRTMDLNMRSRGLVSWGTYLTFLQVACFAPNPHISMRIAPLSSNERLALVTNGKGGGGESNQSVMKEAPVGTGASNTAEPESNDASKTIQHPPEAIGSSKGVVEPVLVGSQQFDWPIRARGVTSLYGPRSDPITGTPGFHFGVDLQADYGERVSACGAGRVVFAGRRSGHGRLIILEHYWGWRTAYSHLSRIWVKRGESVRRGQLIGLVGSSGRTTGPHLHLEVTQDGSHRDPLAVLGRRIFNSVYP